MILLDQLNRSETSRIKNRSGFARSGTATILSVLCVTAIFVTGWAAMNSADQPTPEDCREVAREVRQMAEQARLPEIRSDLLDLAARFERMAELFEASGPPSRPRHN